MFNRKDVIRSLAAIPADRGLVIFVVVEIASVVIGIGMARTITGAVHRLYERHPAGDRGRFLAPH